MVMITLAGIFMAPSASAAGYGCPGSQIDTYAIKSSGGTTYGTVHLYYNSSTGSNCAVAVANSTGGSGQAGWFRSVAIMRCAETTPGGPCTTVSGTYKNDAGYYLQYAGPVTVTAAGKCIKVYGAMHKDGAYAEGYSKAAHCG